MRTMMKTAAAVLGIAFLAGCGKKAEAPVAEKTIAGADSAAAPGAALPVDLFLKAMPEGGTAVGDLKKTAKEGDSVVIRGRIGGNPSPFVDGRAVFTIADPKLLPCTERSAEDTCPTPWDYCCEERPVLTANTATIEVDDADGRALRAAVKGVAGLAEMKTVTVVGVVGPRPDPAVLVVRAKGIFVE